MAANIFGIDFGTTFCCASTYQHGKVEIISNCQGNRKIPSTVSFSESQLLIGDEARNQLLFNPENTIFDFNRMIGKTFQDLAHENYIKQWPFRVQNDAGKPKIIVSWNSKVQSFSPEQISSMMLMKLKDMAETYLGCIVNYAVISVPAHFNPFQRQAIVTAGKIAGLKVLRIMNATTAAAIAYCFHKNINDKRNLLFFDMGGGSTYVTIINIENGKFEVKSTVGNTNLSGEEFDNCLVNYFTQQFNKKHKKDISENEYSLRRLRAACKEIKHSLSSCTKVDIEIYSLYEGLNFKTSINRAVFEEFCTELFSAILELVQKSLRELNLNKDQIEDIILIGGSTRIPKVQKLLQDFFDGKKLVKSINPDEAVAYGAAIQVAAYFSCGNKNEYVKNLSVLDITTSSLCIQNSIGIMIPIIPRNIILPAKTTLMFSTCYDNQTNLIINIYESERTMGKEKILLAAYKFINIFPTPKNKPLLAVTFYIDVNGILNVSAVGNLLSDTEKQITTKINRDYECLHTSEYERIFNKEPKKRKYDKWKHRIAAKYSFEDYHFNMKSIFENKNHS